MQGRGCSPRFQEYSNLPTRCGGSMCTVMNSGRPMVDSLPIWLWAIHRQPPKAPRLVADHRTPAVARTTPTTTRFAALSLSLFFSRTAAQGACPCTRRPSVPALSLHRAERQLQPTAPAVRRRPRARNDRVPDPMPRRSERPTARNQAAEPPAKQTHARLLLCVNGDHCFYFSLPPLLSMKPTHLWRHYRPFLPPPALSLPPAPYKRQQSLSPFSCLPKLAPSL